MNAQAQTSTRTRRHIALAGIGIAAFLAALPLAAHHSFSAEFDAS